MAAFLMRAGGVAVRLPGLACILIIGLHRDRSGFGAMLHSGPLRGSVSTRHKGERTPLQRQSGDQHPQQETNK